MKSVIFDLDGTLADTSRDLIAAANHCFDSRGLGRPLDDHADALTAFHGGRAMLRLGYERLGQTWSEADVDSDFPRLLTFYDQNIDAFTTLYDGVVPTLDRLRDQGYALGICTNKPEALAVKLINRLGLTPYFPVLLGADTLAVRKPDPAHLLETILRLGGRRDAAVLIGDTNTDRQTALNASVPCVLVRFGPEGDAISRLRPEALLDHYRDLPDVVGQLLEHA